MDKQITRDLMRKVHSDVLRTIVHTTSLGPDASLLINLIMAAHASCIVMIREIAEIDGIELTADEAAEVLVHLARTHPGETVTFDPVDVFRRAKKAAARRQQ